MKRNSLFLLLIISSAFIAGCKKTGSTVPPPATISISGYWKGKYSNNTQPPNLPIAALFRPDKTVRFFDGADTLSAYKGEGTYSISGTTVTYSFHYFTAPSVLITFTGQLDAAHNNLQGSWSNNSTPPISGDFYIIRQ